MPVRSQWTNSATTAAASPSAATPASTRSTDPPPPSVAPGRRPTCGPPRRRRGRRGPARQARAGSLRRSAIASASAGAVSATTTPLPTRSSMPSQPTDVATTGRPTSSASMILSRVPPPARNGATTTLDLARNGLTSATVPVTSMRSSARARTAGAGSLPTRRSRASGTRVRTSGQISRPSHTAASTLGAHPREATNATVASGASGRIADGSRPFGQTRTDRAPSVSLAFSRSLTTMT